MTDGARGIRITTGTTDIGPRPRRIIIDPTTVLRRPRRGTTDATRLGSGPVAIGGDSGRPWPTIERLFDPGIGQIDSLARTGGPFHLCKITLLRPWDGSAREIRGRVDECNRG
jgi:hypothetical protein